MDFKGKGFMLITSGIERVNTQLQDNCSTRTKRIDNLMQID